MINYLRVSVTDRCNLSCIYCPPFTDCEFIPHPEILRYEEITRAVKLLNEFGISKVRITGGEPLLRKNILDLVEMLKEINLLELNITTNGVGLNELLRPLKAKGIDRINISLNTLKKERYLKITGKDEFQKVWSAIEDAIRNNWEDDVKLNVILFKGINEDEIYDFTELSYKFKFSIRFIEYFSTHDSHLSLNLNYIPNTVVKESIEKRFGALSPDNLANNNGPARNYRLKDAKGTIGFIDGNTGMFCGTCNRLRLSSDGKLYSCLFGNNSFDLKRMLRNNTSCHEIKKNIINFIQGKKYYNKRNGRHDFYMRKIGG